MITNQSLEKALRPLLKKLPRRIFEQDRDQTWNLSMSPTSLKERGDEIHVIDRVVPVYQSGWEGGGIHLSVHLPKEATAEEIAAALIAEARGKILADPDAIGFVDA